MMTTIFNSTFENVLRLTILIDTFKGSQTEDMLYAIDFIAQYGVAFNISDKNLHGENPFMFSEFATRKKIIRLVLKNMVLEGYVKPCNSSVRIIYALTGDGKAFVSELSSEYANDYRQLVELTIERYGSKSERYIIAEIHKLSKESLERRTLNE
ncbi:hypothetical protein KGF41_15465 [Clostridioides sp. ZZV14-6150]|uniref:ABC-three component system middle component 2 n=1 Tax=Clostridioides sp. ZZV14-6150 TaxID=2811493 RepID=UPI001D11F68E|nr:hypothetical protein [Clostridioides sp. ZZV14-6150]